MNGTVEEFCGTSSATPFVAGVAGLVLLDRAVAAGCRGDPFGAGRRCRPGAGGCAGCARLAAGRGRHRAARGRLRQDAHAGQGPGHGHRGRGGSARGGARRAVRRWPASSARTPWSRTCFRAGSPRRAHRGAAAGAARLRPRGQRGRRPPLHCGPTTTQSALMQVVRRGRSISPRGRPTRPGSPGWSCSSTVGRPRDMPDISGNFGCRRERGAFRSVPTTGPGTYGWQRPADLAKPAGKLAG